MKTDQHGQPPKFYTIAQIADVVEVSTRTVRRWIGEELLVAHRINGLVRVSETDFRRNSLPFLRPTVGRAVADSRTGWRQFRVIEV